jgi:hypothetical protein
VGRGGLILSSEARKIISEVDRFNKPPLNTGARAKTCSLKHVKLALAFGLKETTSRNFSDL